MRFIDFERKERLRYLRGKYIEFGYTLVDFNKDLRGWIKGFRAYLKENGLKCQKMVL